MQCKVIEHYHHIIYQIITIPQTIGTLNQNVVTKWLFLTIKITITLKYKFH